MYIKEMWMKKSDRIKKKINRNMHAVCVLTAFFATVITMLTVICILVVTVDPFFHYHTPLKDFPYVVDNQLSQNPGMARNMIYDSCIIGSSMTVNFDTDDFKQIMGMNTIKLSYSGALPHDDYNILKLVFDSDSYARKQENVKAVFLGVDAMTYTAGVSDTKYPLPEYLYDKNPFNDISYLLNKDVLLEYILRPIVNRDPTDLSQVYASWWTPDYYNIKWVMHNYEPSAKISEVMPADELISGTKDNLEKNILPFIKAHPETEFYMFFPPYSILYWNDVQNENHFEATLNQYEYIADTLLQYDNVRVFYFQNLQDIVTNLNNYADYTHYKPEINEYMVTCFAKGTCEVKKGEMPQQLEKMRDIVEHFDFEGLFSTDY